MKHLNELENDLRSWTPRRPSEKIRRRLFDAIQEPAQPRWPLWVWLSPAAAACAFILCLGVARQDKIAYLAVAFERVGGGHRPRHF
jgi:hypothetical protein